METSKHTATPCQREKKQNITEKNRLFPAGYFLILAIFDCERKEKGIELKSKCPSVHVHGVVYWFREFKPPNKINATSV